MTNPFVNGLQLLWLFANISTYTLEGSVSRINGIWPSFLTIELVCSICDMRLDLKGGEFQNNKVSYPVFTLQPVF